MSQVRRVVTGQSKNGRAVISSDGAVPVVFGSEGGPILFEIWKTMQTPSLLTDAHEEPAEGPLTLQPPAGGSVFRISIIPPDSEMAEAEHHEIFDQLGDTANGDDHSAQMHRTNTIDFAIVMKGSIILVVDDGETELKVGDVVVQRGANHAWSNRGSEPCHMAFVMIDARYPS